MVFTKIEFCHILSLKLAKQGPKVYRTFKKRFSKRPYQVSIWDRKNKTKGHKVLHFEDSKCSGRFRILGHRMGILKLYNYAIPIEKNEKKHYFLVPYRAETGHIQVFRYGMFWKVLNFGAKDRYTKII